MIHRRTWAEIDLERLRFNYRLLKSRLPQVSFFCPMIKADAYGHGDVPVAKALAQTGCTHVGVSLIEEGLKVRASGFDQQILTFGVFDRIETAIAIIEARLTPVIGEWLQLEALIGAAEKSKSSAANPIKIHLKFNTGMNRLGFEVGEAPKVRDWLSANSQFKLEGIASHLLRGDDAGSDRGESDSQFAAFTRALEVFKDLSIQPHILNSSAELNLSERFLRGKRSDVLWPVGARPGIALYGVEPENDEAVSIGLKPVLKLVSHLVEIRRINKGERVSYGGTWRAARDSVIGVVPAGYADGIFRSLSNIGEVLVHGQRVKIAGIVCMDFFMIDLTDVAGNDSLSNASKSVQKGPRIGDEVVLIGEQGRERITASEVATLSGTIPYEVFTRLSQRVPRQYLGEYLGQHLDRDSHSVLNE